jgi:hypothetical protein
MIFQQLIDIYLPSKKEPDTQSENSVESSKTEEVLESENVEN